MLHAVLWEPEGDVPTLDAVNTRLADHMANDTQQFAALWKILSVAGTVILAVAGWSLKSQYDAMHQAAVNTSAQLEEVRTVEAQLTAMGFKPPTSSVGPLPITPAR